MKKRQNPYKGAQFTLASGECITELRLGKSNEKALASNGEINAHDRREQLAKIGELIVASANGQIVKKDDVTASVDRKMHREVLAAAYNDATGNQWRQLGVELAASIEQNTAREGFLRNFLMEETLNQGEIPKARMRYLNVMAVVAASPMDVAAQLVRDKLFYPPEFYINANIEVENRDIDQISSDILDEKYAEGLQAIMVAEDRLLRKSFDATVGVSNPIKYLAGGLTPATLSALRTSVTDWKLPAVTALISNDFWNDIVGNTDFMSLLDPVTKYDLVLNGELGTLLGMRLMTDGYRQPELQVLDRGEIYIISAPQNVGQYTTRGGVESTPVDGAILSKTTKGWFLSESLSLVLPNSRAIAKGKRL